nr:alpha-N-acetylgalactosamine-specific lectin-like [Misgurnus anguillicaudatus]
MAEEGEKSEENVLSDEDLVVKMNSTSAISWNYLGFRRDDAANTGLCLFTQCISCQSILIQKRKTWYDAQAYCRQNHIDLATVQSNEDWMYIQGAVRPSLTSLAWIGLYNDIYSWRWSYQDANITFQLWAAGEPDNNYANEACALMRDDMWRDYPCTRQYPFICYDGKK